MNPIAQALSLLRGDPSADRAVPPSGATGHLTAIAAVAMAVLMVFALALALASDRMATRWSGLLSGVATLEVPMTEAGPDDAFARAELVLGQTPGIRAVTRLPADDIRALLTPWFGDTSALDDSDLPLLLAITETPKLDRQALAARLEGELPGAVYHRHSAWAERIANAAARVRLIAWGFALTALGVAAIVVTLAARAALAVHTGVIETLRLIGARDSYIVRAFVRRFTLRAAFGALIGLLLALLLLRSLGAAHTTTLGALLPASPSGWLLLCAVPLAIALTAFLTTRRAALRVLLRVS